MTEHSRADIRETVHGSATSIPAAFWLHFRNDYLAGDAAAREHLRFVLDTETDIVKLMNEHPYPFSHDMSSPQGWARVPRMTPSDAWFREQVDDVKRAVDLVDGQKPVIATVFGPVAASYHTGRGQDEVFRGAGPVGQPDPELDRLRIGAHLAAEPALVDGVLDMIADLTAELASQFLQAGAGGIYYSAWGGERRMMTDEQFETHVKPKDLRVLEAVSGATVFNVLHICKPDTDLTRYRDYRPQVVNWASHGNGVSIEAGRSYFPEATILGGISTTDPALHGEDPQAAADLARTVIDSLSDRRRFILGADCALPMSTPEANIRAAARVAHEYPV
jgi:uroporphyrinogen decarboxylase